MQILYQNQYIKKILLSSETKKNYFNNKLLFLKSVILSYDISINAEIIFSNQDKK